MADQRDWDKEMAEIDRLMRKQGIAPDGAPSPAAPPPRRGSAPATSAAGAAPVARSGARVAAPAPAEVLGRGRRLQLWLMAALGPLGAAGLVVWPYARACGAGLAVYLVGVAAVLAAGGWTMRAGWVTRRGRILVLGLLTLLAALALTALEVLPRVGYAANLLTWTCST